ncbi:hypothetical protein O3Q52_20100 [Streptomyces sp. ActVer]|uniref:hypothetical protein n=1 Tax=Streptomyces sp. ActVer TaxID=3014558 RepID=UPI0022B47CBD|nr:hypothetical protein [Streptomyces sp. ActVer]MCZ4510450.1 hypothetical protein [Streptomyces sp. ActVer]
MGQFSKGDKVTVTNPVQPTRFQGGETGEVVRTDFRDGMVQIRDEDDVLASVHPTEITKD